VETDFSTGEGDSTLRELYASEDGVEAVIHVKLEKREGETVAERIAEEPHVKDVFMVTGDSDLILIVSFPRMKDLKEYVLHELTNIYGVVDTKTFVVIKSVKEDGIKNY